MVNSTVMLQVAKRVEDIGGCNQEVSLNTLYELEDMPALFYFNFCQMGLRTAHVDVWPTQVYLVEHVKDLTSRALPKGKYKEKCQLCMFAGTALWCTCKNDDGSEVFLALEAAESCANLEYTNSGLVCQSKGDKVQVALPAGSYQKSCQNCTLDGTVLCCSCKRPEGKEMQQTCLTGATQCNGVHTRLGELTCEFNGHPLTLPLDSGTYQDSCKQCTGTITRQCICGSTNGKKKTSSFVGAHECKLQNHNGNLACTHIGPTLPPVPGEGDSICM